MPQQYLPPALMLEQLRNERYRQAAQGMQQGLGQALQTFMTMEQLKQAAAEKKAERDERARQFNESQRLREAELQSLRDLREGKLGLQQQQQALAEKKAADAQAAVADAQDLAQLNLTAFGVDPKQRAVAGVDTQTAAEFMRKGLRDFGQQRQAAAPKPEYEPVSREQILGIARPETVDRFMQAEERTAPITARQAFEALPAGDDERAKTRRLMDALAADETAGIRRDFPTQETQQATIAPDAARILDRLAATEKQATGQAQQLFSNLDALLEAQQRRPQDFATAELYRDAGGKRAFGEVSGARREQEFRQQKELLGLDKLKAETSALKALETQRKAAARGAGRGRAEPGAGLKKEQFMAAIQREANSRRVARVEPLYALARDFEAKAQELQEYTKNRFDEKGIAPTPEERDEAAKYKMRAEQLREKAEAEDEKVTAFFNEKLAQYGLPQQQTQPTAQYEMPEQSMMTQEQLAEVQNQPDLRDRLTEVKTPRSLAEAKTEAAEIAARGDATTQEELNAWLEENAGSRKANLIEQDLKRYYDLGLKMDEAVNLIGRDYLGKNWLQKGAREMVAPRLDSLLKGAQKL